MTSLNSLLSSIGGGQAPPPDPPASGPAKITRPALPVRKASTQPNGQRRDALNGVQPPKRKLEEISEGPKPKVQRVEQNPSPTRLSATAMNGASSSKLATPSSGAPMPYRGTAKISTVVPASTTAKSASKPMSKPVNSATSSPAPDSAADAAKPKRGFQAALEKAKAAQEAAKAMGQIKHKPVEKLTTRDRLRLQQGALEKMKLARSGKLPPQQRSRSAATADPKSGVEYKEQRRPEKSSYKGTMKPREPASYRGTMRTPGGAPPRSQSDDRRGSESRGKLGTDKYDGHVSCSALDESSLSDQGDGEGYGSDASSDMEAGLDDVEEEEMESGRIAKKEDVEAAKEEDKLKKEKLERKRKLEQLSMAAARQKKKF